MSSPLRSDIPESSSLTPRTQLKTETRKSASPSTSPTHLASTKKIRAPPPPCSPSKESRIPKPSGAGNPERPPRRKKSSSGEEPTSPAVTEGNTPSSPRSSFLYNQEQQGTLLGSSAVEENFSVIGVKSNDLLSSPEVISSDRISQEPSFESDPFDFEPARKDYLTVIETTPVRDIVNSEHHKNQEEDIIVNHLDVKLIEIVPEISEEKSTESKVVSFSKGHTEIPNPETVSLCSIDSIPPELPSSAPPPFIPKQTDSSSIGEEAEVIAQEVKVTESFPTVKEEEIVKPREILVENSSTTTKEETVRIEEILVGSSPTVTDEKIVKTEEILVEKSTKLNFSDSCFENNLVEESNFVTMSTEVSEDLVVPTKESMEISSSLKTETEVKEVESDTDSDLSDLVNQNGSFTPGKPSVNGTVSIIVVRAWKLDSDVWLLWFL